MKEYRDFSNRLSIELAGKGDSFLFKKYTNILKTEFNGEIAEKLDGLDQKYWDFNISGITVVLHSDSMAGISIHIEDGSNDDYLRIIGKRLLK